MSHQSHTHTQSQVKVIGLNGQLSLGKSFAGKMVLVDQIDEGTWIVKAGQFIPDSEKWLYQGDNMAKLERGLKWAKENKPQDNFDQFISKIEKK